MEENYQEQQDQSSKVKKNYEKAMADLTKVIGGKTLFKPSKLVPDDVMAAVKELALEEKTSLLADFKQKAVELIKKKRDHDKLLVQLHKELQQKEESSMKSFVDDAQKLFKMLASIESIEENYYDILMSAATGQNSVKES